MKKILLLSCMLLTTPCFAWDGINSYSGKPVDFWADKEEITNGDIVDAVDMDTAKIRHLDVLEVSDDTVEVMDIETGEIEFYDMD